MAKTPIGSAMFLRKNLQNRHRGKEEKKNEMSVSLQGSEDYKHLSSTMKHHPHYRFSQSKFAIIGHSSHIALAILYALICLLLCRLDTYTLWLFNIAMENHHF